jgi:hypothetical protein
MGDGSFPESGIWCDEGDWSEPLQGWAIGICRFGFRYLGIYEISFTSAVFTIVYGLWR